jgi:hypothetical protein
LDELVRRDIQLLAAVQPWQKDDAIALVSEANARGLSIGLWPLLDDARGRWLHPGDARDFMRFVDALLAALDAAGERIDCLVLDLEPPIAEVKKITEGRLGAARAWLARELDPTPHRRVVEELKARSVEAFAAVLPPILASGRAGVGWQKALGTPVDGVGWDAVSVMLYTSLFEGYSFGAVGRDDACALLSRFASLARSRFGSRASVSLGAVGVGALGDERTYRAPEELARDVALARVAGIDDLALFDLSGVVARPPVDAWLDAFVASEPATEPAPSTAAARAVAASLWVTGVALDAAGRLAR